MNPNLRFLLAALVVLCIALAMGCSTLTNQVMDRAGAQMVNEAIDYCAGPDYRRKALNLLINGRLSQHHIRIDITCPQD